MHASGAIHGKGRTLLLIGYGNSGLPFYGRYVPVERALQSGLIEHYRVQGLRETANGFESSLDNLEHFLQIGSQ